MVEFFQQHVIPKAIDMFVFIKTVIAKPGQAVFKIKKAACQSRIPQREGKIIIIIFLKPRIC